MFHTPRTDEPVPYPQALYFVAVIWMLLGLTCWWLSLKYVFDPKGNDSCCMAFALPGAGLVIAALRLLLGYAAGTSIYFVISLFFCLPAVLVMVLIAALGGEYDVFAVTTLFLLVMFVTASLAVACQEDYLKWKLDRKLRSEDEDDDS